MFPGLVTGAPVPYTNIAGQAGALPGLFVPGLQQRPSNTLRHWLGPNCCTSSGEKRQNSFLLGSSQKYAKQVTSPKQIMSSVSKMAYTIQRKMQPPNLVGKSPDYPQEPGRTRRWKVFNQQYGLLFIGKALPPINLLPIPRKVSETVPHLQYPVGMLSHRIHQYFPVRVTSYALSGRIELFSVSNDLFLSWLSSGQHEVHECSYK